MRRLLVQPAFPTPHKSKNGDGFVPIGLLKLAAYYRNLGDDVRLVNGNQPASGFTPESISVTSLFTYWASFVRDTVSYYRGLFGDAYIEVGGVYASLMPDHCRSYTGCDSVFVGLHPEAENCVPAYDLVHTRKQIVHASRGCPRRCAFCGVWRIEPRFVPKRSIKDDIQKRVVLFYDNNFLANPYIHDILDELRAVRVGGRPVRCEAQSGLDGRILLESPDLAVELRRARFTEPRIAWDGSYEDRRAIREQLRILRLAGFRPKDTYVFMLYNWSVPFDELLAKLRQCRRWGVQVADCRYRPLDQTHDAYRPGATAKAAQDDDDYHIHRPVWTDSEVRAFRKAVREHNIAMRLGEPYCRAKELAGKAARSR